MKFSLPVGKVPNKKATMRKAGYFEFVDPNTGEHSFVSQLGPGFYPRFHLYIEEKGEVMNFNLHLDQKKPSYGQGHMHSGEYDGAIVEKEITITEAKIGSIT